MKNEVIIRKILGYTDKIVSYIDGVSYDEFSKNTMIMEACVFDLSQIGELVNKLDLEFINSHSEIPWRQIYGLRNRIVHDYDGVNLLLVWQIICDDIPKLKEKCSSLITGDTDS